ncbi:hypothetical protein [Natronorubrum sp. A-ect3]|uniref:hypothetical protein n=1 Tax=Natronorubrum sp. A-ect3 TaxID=3242698 RepID=UPI00359DB741
MGSENYSPGPIVQSLAPIASRTNKWWYLPVLAGASSLFLTLVTLLTTPQADEAIQAFAVLAVLPTTLLSIPAIIFDILNKFGGTLPPGIFLYPLGLVMSLFTNTMFVIPVTITYFLIWVWPAKKRIPSVLPPIN